MFRIIFDITETNGKRHLTRVWICNNAAQRILQKAFWVLRITSPWAVHRVLGHTKHNNTISPAAKKKTNGNNVKCKTNSADVDGNEKNSNNIIRLHARVVRTYCSLPTALVYAPIKNTIFVRRLSRFCSTPKQSVRYIWSDCPADCHRIGKMLFIHCEYRQVTAVRQMITSHHTTDS